MSATEAFILRMHREGAQAVSVGGTTVTFFEPFVAPVQRQKRDPDEDLPERVTKRGRDGLTAEQQVDLYGAQLDLFEE